MPERVIPIAQGKRDDLTDWGNTDSRFINWVADIDGCLHQRPGLSLVEGLTVNSSGVDQNIIGAYVWRSPIDLQTYLVYVRADRFIVALNLSTKVISDLTSAALPDTYLDGSGTRAIFTENTIHLIIAGGGQLQAWTGAGLSARLGPSATWNPITNQPPIAASHAAYLSNYIVANNNTPGGYGQFVWSDIGDGNDGTWNPLNFNTADASPDRVMGVYSSLSELYIFGEKTMQVYGISSDQYLPFSPACSIAIGCGAKYSPIQLENQFAWLDNKRRFVVSDGRGFSDESSVISVPVEKTLRGLSTVSDCWGFRLQVDYYDLLVWVFPTASVCLVFDARRKAWSTWESLDQIGASILPRMGAAAYDEESKTYYVGDSLYENIWTVDHAANTDLGAPIRADLVLCRDDYEVSAHKSTRYVDIFLKRGQSASGGTFEFATRDDDSSWQPYHSVSIGTSGDYSSNVRWYPGGVFQRRQFRIRYSGSADTSLSKVVDTFDARSR